MTHTSPCRLAGKPGASGHDPHTIAGCECPHDELCPSAYTFGACECPLIARVRADERTRDYSGISVAHHLDRLRENYAHGYAAALRDAVEAVKLSCSADIELVERSEVIAAIESLPGFTTRREEASRAIQFLGGSQ